MKSFPSTCCLLLLLSTTVFASPFPGDTTPTLPTTLSTEQLQYEPTQQPSRKKRQYTRFPWKEGESSKEHRIRYQRERRKSIKAQHKVPKSLLSHLPRQEGESTTEFRSRYQKDYKKVYRRLAELEREPSQPKVTKISLPHLFRQEGESKSEFNKRRNREYKRIRRALDKMEKSQSEPVKSKGSKTCNGLGTSNQSNPFTFPAYPPIEHFQQSSSTMVIHHEPESVICNNAQKRKKVNSDNTTQKRTKLNAEVIRKSTRTKVPKVSLPHLSRQEDESPYEYSKRYDREYSKIYSMLAKMEKLQSEPVKSKVSNECNGLGTSNHPDPFTSPAYPSTEHFQQSSSLMAPHHGKGPEQVIGNNIRKRKKVNVDNDTQKRTKLNADVTRKRKKVNLDNATQKRTTDNHFGAGAPSAAPTGTSFEIWPTAVYNPPAPGDLILIGQPSSALPVNAINCAIESHNNIEELSLPATYKRDPPVHYKVHVQNTGHSMTSFLKCNGLPSTFTGILPMELAKSIPQSRIVNGKERIVDRTFLNWVGLEELVPTV